MRFGVSIFVTDETVPPAELGPLIEERGFATVSVPEHTHLPLSSEQTSGRTLGPEYRRSLDPFVVLTALGAATSTLRLGFGICLIAQRDPIVTAKAVASLDRLSGGRVDFGIGAGWNRVEIEHHGTPFDRRFGIMRERVEAMRALWTQDAARYDGRHVSLAPSESWPKPVQDPLPVYVGGNGERVLDRVIRYGDHWMPNREIDLERRIPELRRRAADAGRPRPDVAYFGCAVDEAQATRLLDAGVDQVLFMLPSAGRDRVEPVADAAADLAARLRS